MKGITPVIAIILLLMITIAMVGFAFVWFTSVATQLGNATERMSVEQTNQMQTKAKIENIDKASNTTNIRNSGFVALDLAKTIVYVNDSIQVNCGAGFSGSIQPGSVAACTNVNIGGCRNIAVTTIGTGDTRDC